MAVWVEPAGVRSDSRGGHSPVRFDPYIDLHTARLESTLARGQHGLHLRYTYTTYRVALQMAHSPIVGPVLQLPYLANKRRETVCL